MKIIDADALFKSLIFPTEKFKTAFKQVLDDEPAVDLCKCFDGMTNGEVIQTLFPNETMFEQTETCTYYGNMRFDTGWWNAPYQKGRK